MKSNSCAVAAMTGGTFERVFPKDRISKRERVELTLSLRGVDRAALHEQLSYNPGVIAAYTQKEIDGFNYALEDIGMVIRKTLDMCFPPVAPVGADRVTDQDGFVSQRDNWTTWHVSRPFSDVEGATGWMKKVVQREYKRYEAFDADRARREHRTSMSATQRLIGETVLCGFSGTGFCTIFDRMGLELYSYFSMDHPELLDEFMELSTDNEIRRVHAVADRSLSPVVLIPEDFSTKQGPIFAPEFLHRFHYPYVKALTGAWHDHGLSVLYHSDGNYRKVIPDLMTCGVDGFYCLEPNCAMDIVEFKKTWPGMVWAGGVDGVDLMERGTPAEVKTEVHRHILETDALRSGGMFVASSSEINPPIPPENFTAMVEAVGEKWNPDFG